MMYPIDWARTGQLTVVLALYGWFVWSACQLLHRHSPTNWEHWPDYEEPKEKKDFPALAEDDDSKLVA